MKMKKEIVSVLKPHNDKKSKSRKTAKIEKAKSDAKIQKKKMAASPRVAAKPKIVAVQQLDCAVDLMKNKKVKSENVDGVKKQKVAANRDEKKSRKRRATDTCSDKDAPMAEKTRGGEIAAVPEKKDNKPAKLSRTSKKRKMLKIKTEIVNSGDLKLTKKHIGKVVEAIIKLTQEKSESKKTLLPADNTSILLQVTCVKVPSTPRRNIRPFLPHRMVGPLDDVAVFVPDLVRGRKQDYEKTVDHWETIFREKGVDCINEIIPMNRMKTEYSQYEMKRKLAASFDYFLADARICRHLTHLLGRNFIRRSGQPTPVKLERNDLKESIDFALSKTCMEIHSHGNTHTMKIGCVSMDKSELVENVLAACETLDKEYPGGWENIRMLQLKSRVSLGIPIFVNLKSKNDVARPHVAPKRPRAYETVEGELTTIPGNTTVKMTPEGKITVKRERDPEFYPKKDVEDASAVESDVKKEENEDEEEDDNDDDEDEDDDQ